MVNNFNSHYMEDYIEHSWGPWKKHKYISKIGTGVNAIYKYADSKIGFSAKKKYDSAKDAQQRALKDYRDSLEKGVVKKRATKTKTYKTNSSGKKRLISSKSDVSNVYGYKRSKKERDNKLKNLKKANSNRAKASKAYRGTVLGKVHSANIHAKGTIHDIGQKGKRFRRELKRQLTPIDTKGKKNIGGNIYVSYGQAKMKRS